MLVSLVALLSTSAQVGNPKFGAGRLISAFAAQGRSSPQNRPRRPLERSPSELNRGMDSRISFDLLEDCRRAQEAAGMALSVDLRERVVGAVEGGMSRNAAAKRFGVTIASAVRWVARFKAKGEISPSATGGDRRSGRIE